MTHQIKEKTDRSSWKPILIESDRVSVFISENPAVDIIDQYYEQLKEIFFLRNPKFRFDKNFQNELEGFTAEHFRGKFPHESGTWFYFPWLKALIHFLSEDLHLEARTGRNPYLITREEQKKFYESRIGVMGMSVGSHAAIVIAMTGGGKTMCLADLDVLAASNLNRIRTGFQNLGLAKVIAVARQIYEINPYSNIEIFSEGVTEENIEKIINGPDRLDILIEEMDNPYFKFKSRELLKKYKIPLVSAADNGDGIIAHIERYNEEEDLKLFNGIMGDMTAEQVKDLDKKEIIGVIAKTVGADRAVLRMQESVLDVGTKLYSWPQLGTAANMCGTVLAYLARKIVLGVDNIKSGIYDVSLDSIFESDYHDPSASELRKDRTKKFLEKLGI